jgi:hypothetical protein
MKVTQGMLEGKTADQIAPSVGVSTRQVHRDSASPEVQDLITQALGAQHEALIAGCALSIRRLIEGLDAEWKGAPDWRSRGLCARELRELLAMAIGPRTQQVEVKQKGRSIEELLEDYRGFVAAVVETPDAD